MSEEQDQLTPSAPPPAASGAQPDAAQGRTEEVVSQESDNTDWKKRYNDSTREVNSKLKPALEKANYIAQKTGYSSVEELYAAIKEQEMNEANVQPQSPVETNRNSSQSQPAPATTVNPAAVVEPLAKDVEMLKKEQAKRNKQEVDAEFEAFYEAYPEAKEKEAELLELTKPLWRTQVGGKYKYERLREALQDAYLIANKEQFMEKSKLDALTELQKQSGAAQSLLGSSSRKAAPAKQVQLTPEQRRVAQKFIDKGIFKDEQDYINSL